MWHTLTTTSPNGIPIGVWLIGILLLLTLLLSFVILPLITLIRRHAAPVCQLHVTVLTTERRSILHISGCLLSLLFGSSTRFNWRGKVYDDIDKYAYLLLVESVDTHQQMEFKISEEDCGRFQPDDEGMLTYLYDRLLDFMPMTAPPAPPVTTSELVTKPALIAAAQNPNELGEWDWTHDQSQSSTTKE